jgi:hypothetical protein
MRRSCSVRLLWSTKSCPGSIARNNQRCLDDARAKAVRWETEPEAAVEPVLRAVLVVAEAQLGSLHHWVAAVALRAARDEGGRDERD